MSSDWKQRAVARRDARHTHDGPREQPRSAAKNRKRWCRGRIGVDHKPVCRNYADFKTREIAGQKLFRKWRVLVCSECGKELKHYYGFKTEKKPDWVTC
jgi:hypothetical protein